MDERAYWVCLSQVSGIGPVRFQRLIAHFGTAAAVWKAAPVDLVRAGLDQRTAEAIIAQRASLDPDAVWSRIRQRGVEVLRLSDDAYPARLREIHDPPPVLYLRGSLLPSDALCVAVVGTRRNTTYGRQATEGLVADLCRNGVTIVSGLARGIDGIAHRAALRAGGRTIAVLGSGVDVIYPAEHTQLAREIVDHGALLSEYPVESAPEPGNFPARNRIISGLAPATLVIEAPEGSGALITSDFALEQGRDVFAVPGSIFARPSDGTNQLIQQGAKLVRCAQDVLDELQVAQVEQQLVMRELLPADDTEDRLLRLLSQEPRHVDDLVRNSGLPTSTVASTLTIMELKGLVRSVGSMQYVAAR
ncbi:MAG: DNA-protecting protein DprA [Chloroflexi bacterium]|nr:DNA-protecting protein DprA [Chloroflexota bacterium]